MSSEIQLIGAVIAIITAPACGYLAWWVRRLYSDNQKLHRRFESLLREAIRALNSIEITDEPTDE